MKNLQVLDAVETLSQLSQVSDKSHPELIPQPERIKKAFETISLYLCDLYQSDQMLLKNHDYLASLKAVMIIAEEAYDKLEYVSKIFNKTKSDLGEYEFSHLYDFYLKKINFKVEHVAGDVFRHQEQERQRAIEDTHGIKNLEVIRKDSEYELFYIKDEEGLNHFSKNLLRHTQLLGTFDEMFLTFQGEDPFVRLKFIEDRIKQKRALSVRKDLAPRIDYFLKEAFRFKKQPFIGQTCCMLNALFLASYPSLVLQNDPSKACFEYFNDILTFLTSLVSKAEFFRSGSSMELISDKGVLASQRFISGVIASLFFSKNDSRYIAEHLYQYIQKPKTESFSPLSFFDKLLEFDQDLRRFLLNFPSGPLMKALDFMKDSDRPISFHPMRECLPQNLVNLSYLDRSISLISLASPTIQSDVKLASIDPIFSIFLNQIEGQKTLLIELEDVHSSFAAARVSAIINLETTHLRVSCIPKAGLLYQMHDIYSFIDKASEFKKIVMEQCDHDENHTYSRSHLAQRDINTIFDFIHKHLFEHKEHLNLKERLIFIETMHLFMMIDLIQKIEPDNLLIVDKDGLDQANAFSLSLYALISLVNHESLFDKATFDFFISELYGPAMTLRDRPIFEESFVRMIGALSVIQAKIVKDPTFCKTLTDQFIPLRTLKIQKN
jgi:hypothetical protein